MSFIEELKRRNVVRVGVAYIVVGWLLLQVTDIVVPIMELPNSVAKVVLFLLMLGFPLVLFFAWAFELTPDGIKKEKDVDRSESMTHATGRKLDRAIIGILVIALGWFAWDKFARTAPETPATDTAATPVVEEAIDKSIAVLPFVNMSEDTANEFFSDGISEEILNALAKVKDLKVAGRTSSFAFKGRNEDLRQIGEALSVSHILEGSVRKADNQVRITAQLIQVSDGYHLWSETYDRELTNVFAIQDEIAAAILNELKAELLAGESENMVSTQTDPQAYELYLLAKQRIYERKREPLEAALTMLDSALEIDPDYAPALAQRGIATILLKRRHYGPLSTEEADPVAKDFLDRSVATDPLLAEGWAGLGLYYRDQPTKIPESIEVLEKALQLNPNLMNARNWLQGSYRSTRQADKSRALLEDMVARDPLYKPGLGNLILYYNLRGMTDKSLALIERSELFMPGDASLIADRAGTALNDSNFAKSIELFEQSFELEPEAGSNRIGWGIGLLATHQYAKLLTAYMPPWQRVFSMHALGRTEEASIAAHERAAIGDVGPLFSLMNRDGRPEDLVQFFDDRWPDLETFQADYPGSPLSYGVMLDLAFALNQTGDQPRFDDAMLRLKAHLDYLVADGIDVFRLNFELANWHQMEGDSESALDQRERAIDKGGIITERIS
ncbi:MAG: tetratricopeptide repeat protein, partial [Gammaproteobacteria bacterium]